MIAAAVMTAAIYLVTGTVPRSLGRRNAVRVASAAASILAPVVRLLGPLPRLLLAPGGAAGRGGGRRDRRRTCGAWSTCWNSAG